MSSSLDQQRFFLFKDKRAYTRATVAKSRRKSGAEAARIAELSGLNLGQSHKVNRAVWAVIKEALLRHETVEIPLVGTFVPVVHKARWRGLHFCPEHTVATFRPALALRYLVDPEDPRWI